MTMFVRSDSTSWRRTDELHDNVLIETSNLLPLLEAEGVDAQLHAAFGHEALPTGLMVVTGTKA
jgi:hypothetical protein